MQCIQPASFQGLPDPALRHSPWRRRRPYHWGRYRGLAQDWAAAADELLMDNIFFDTCVYHQPGIELLIEVVGVDNVLFASEMVGAVRGIDPRDRPLLRRHQALPRRDRPLGRASAHKLFEGNALRVYPRLRAALSPAGGYLAPAGT